MAEPPPDLTDMPVASAAAEERSSSNASLGTDARVVEVADACFEMFTIRELKQPQSVLPELTAAFPDATNHDILQAISMALTWKRLLKAVGRTLH
jgi:hypothetical protein